MVSSFLDKSELCAKLRSCVVRGFTARSVSATESLFVRWIFPAQGTLRMNMAIFILSYSSPGIPPKTDSSSRHLEKLFPNVM